MIRSGAVIPLVVLLTDPPVVPLSGLVLIRYVNEVPLALVTANEPLYSLGDAPVMLTVFPENPAEEATVPVTVAVQGLAEQFDVPRCRLVTVCVIPVVLIVPLVDGGNGLIAAGV